MFRFEGRAGQEIVAEVVARRLNSPLDSVLKLTDAAGKQWALNDDQEDKGSGLATHHVDSRLCLSLPADGTYYVHLSDVQNKGGAEYAYRLRISPPRPDFALRVVPSSVNARAGMTVPVTVYALRRDGFSAGIAIQKVLPPGREGVALVLSADAEKVKPGLQGNLIHKPSQLKRFTNRAETRLVLVRAKDEVEVTECQALHACSFIPVLESGRRAILALAVPPLAPEHRARELSFGRALLFPITAPPAGDSPSGC